MLGFNPSFSLLSFPCLTRASKRHKAEPHDMYIESNALQRRFMPQPALRSSWLQLVIFSLFSTSCSALSRTSLSLIAGSSPTMTVLFFLLSSSNSSLSYSGLARISPSDSRVKPATACHIQPFFYVMFGLEPDISFLDCRIKSDNDSIIFSSVILELFPVIFGLGPNISFRFPYQARE